MKTMTNIRILVLAIVAMLTVSPQARADEKLYVEYKDGSVFSYVLANKPEVTFQEANIIVTAPEIADTHKMVDVKQFLFSLPTSIEKVNAGEHRLTYTNNNAVRLEGFKAGSTVSVYDINGVLMAETIIDKDGNVVVSLDGMAAGLYVIATAEGKSYKIIKR